MGDLIRGFPPDDPSIVPTVREMLVKYAEALEPWAIAAARRMVSEVNARDADMWMRAAQEMSTELRHELRNAPTGELMRDLMAEQVTLIKSIPLEAAQRVHDLTLEAMADGTRAREIAEMIMRSGEVAESRATLIARTEVARSASTLTQARARHVGSTHYVWRTSEDSDVRPGHKAMNGKTCEWANPPAVNEGGRIMHHHPGEIWNCRCWPQPVLPE